jgi:hypothetical protein
MGGRSPALSSSSGSLARQIRELFPGTGGHEARNQLLLLMRRKGGGSLRKTTDCLERSSISEPRSKKQRVQKWTLLSPAKSIQLKTAWCILEVLRVTFAAHIYGESSSIPVLFARGSTELRNERGLPQFSQTTPKGNSLSALGRLSRLREEGNKP